MVLARYGYTLDDLSRPTYAVTMLITVLVTTVVWLGVTFATKPETEVTLDRFYERVRPGGLGWRAVSRRLGFGDDPIPGGALAWVNWVAGLAAVYCAVVSLGDLLVGSKPRGLLYGAVAIAAFALIMRNLRADERLAASVDRTRGEGLGFSPSSKV
jgi:peptidoglycan/LPS O-acetylase OafA/YrhL